MNECIVAACMNYCCKISWFFCNNSISPPGWPSQDHICPAPFPESPGLYFSQKASNGGEIKCIDLIFLTNFQGIIWELRVSLPRGAPCLHLRSWQSKPCTWGVPRSTVPEERLNLSRGSISSCWPVIDEKSPLGISFIPATYLQVPKSFFPPILSLPNKTQVFLIQSHHAIQLLCTACSAALLQSQHILRNKSNR